MGTFDEGINLCERGLLYSLGTNDLIGLALIEVLYGNAHKFRGEAKEAIEHLEKCGIPGLK
jgi:hypothetical protein